MNERNQKVFFETVDDYKFHPFDPSHTHLQITGPKQDEKLLNIGSHISAWTISTYPFDPLISRRHGDPIADQFGIIQYADNSCIIALADGCNWGDRPFEAAFRARDTFLAYMHRKRPKLTNSVQVVHYMLRGFNKAHEAIFFEKTDPSDAGSTTLIGAVILPIEDLVALAGAPSFAKQPEAESSSSSPTSSKTPMWQLIPASFGDCRAYIHAADGVFKPIGDHIYHPTGRDPGGRLGSWVSDH